MRRIYCLAFFMTFLFSREGKGYVDSSPTLGGICYAATDILVVRVKAVSREKGVIVYEPVAAIKGGMPKQPIRHAVPREADARAGRAVLDWAETGKVAVCFATDKVVLTYTGEGWYECAKGAEDWWSLTRERAEMALVYVGPVSKLRAQAGAIVAGKEVVITAVRHRGTAPALFETVALRTRIRGSQYPVWRLRASLKMPSTYITLTEPNCPWVVGLGAAVKEDLPDLVRSLGQADAGTRADAADELALFGGDARPALSALRERLGDDDPIARVHAAGALLRTGLDAAAAIKVLTGALGDPAAGVRREAALLLGERPTEAAAVVPVLLKALGDREDRVRRAALESLGQFKGDAIAALPALIELLGDREVAEEAAQALSAMGPAAAKAAPALTAALRRAGPASRGVFARALAGVAPTAPVTAAVFLEELRSADERDRWDAVVCFRLLGPAAAEAVPALAKLFRGPAAGPRAAAARVLADLGPHAEKALPVLIEQLANSDVVVRRQALDVLTNMPKQARPAVPALVAGLKDNNAEYARAVANALKLIDPNTAAEHGIK